MSTQLSVTAQPRATYANPCEQCYAEPAVCRVQDSYLNLTTTRNLGDACMERSRWSRERQVHVTGVIDEAWAAARRARLARPTNR